MDSQHISDDYLKVMTLRDCILLIREQQSPADPHFETRLADLDLKQAHPEKVAKWRGTERALVEEGWYTNTESDPIPERVCILSRERK